MNKQTLPPPFISQVRFACKNFDKPDQLGLQPIAGVALRAILLQNPHHPTDTAGRGKALQKVLNISLETLKTEDRSSHAGNVYRCLYAYIHKKDPYLPGVELSNVDAHFANQHIGRTTYYNWRDEGLELIEKELCINLAKQTTLLEPVPLTPHFIERTQELNYYTDRLHEQRLTIIHGVNGIGKTTLAARLAADWQKPVCWLTLRPGLNDTLPAVLHTWAAFAAQHKSPRLWAWIDTHINPAEPLNIDTSIAMLQDSFRKIRPLLCLDNLEAFSESDAAFWSLLKAFQENPAVTFLLISRRQPVLEGVSSTPPLQGLQPEQITQWARQQNLTMTEPQIETLTRYTDGNPRLLELWHSSLRQPSDSEIEASLNTLPALDAVETYLTAQILTSLSEGELRAAWLLALSRRPLPIPLLLNQEAVKLDEIALTPEDFIRLDQRGLIHHEPGDQWNLSPLLSKHLKNPPSDVTQLHLWLADLFTLQGDWIEAAFHHVSGEKPDTAVLLLEQRQQQLMTQGQAYAMNVILKEITPETLIDLVRQCYHDLRSQILCLLGHYAEAELDSKAAARLADTPLMQALVARQVGTVAKLRGESHYAIDCYQKALQLLTTSQITVEAWLHRDLAWELMQKNDLENARQEAQRTQIALENTLGVLARREGNLTETRQHLEQALQLAQKYGERRELARATHNLAALYAAQKEFNRAIELYRGNLELIEELGELLGKAVTLLNMGESYFQLNDFAAALDHETQALPIFDMLGDNRGHVLCHTNAAEALISMQDLDTAQLHLEESLRTASAEVMPRECAETQRVYAEFWLARGDNEKALQWGHQALATLGNRDAQISTWIHRTLARIYAAAGDPAQAQYHTELANAKLK